MNRHTLTTTAVAAIAGAGTAAGAVSIAAPSHHGKGHAPKAVRAVHKDVQKAVRSARREAFSPADAAKVRLGVVEKAHDAGRLTDQQYDRFKVRLDVVKAIAGERGTGGRLTGAQRAAAAKPVLDRAVAAKTIPARAEKRILRRLERGPMRHHRRP